MRDLWPLDRQLRPSRIFHPRPLPLLLATSGPFRLVLLSSVAFCFLPIPSPLFRHLPRSSVIFSALPSCSIIFRNSLPESSGRFRCSCSCGFRCTAYGGSDITFSLLRCRNSSYLHRFELQRLSTGRSKAKMLPESRFVGLR